jgi:transposase
LGYKVYLTETCDEELPHLIVNVETSHAATGDIEFTETIQQSLEQKKLSPREHFLDSGFTTAQLLLKYQEQAIELVGPLREDYSWQAKAGQGFDLTAFTIDWGNKRVICPNGKVSKKWRRMLNGRDKPVIMAHVDRDDCLACLQREGCTKAEATGRMLTFKPSQEEHELMRQMRTQQTTDDFKERYNTRAGIEGTISQGVRSCDLRQSRYLGLAKTHLHNVLSSLAVNVHRLANWFDERPRASTRTARFAQLVA